MLSLSTNFVGRTRGLCVGDSVADGSLIVVAKEREARDVGTMDGRKTLKGDGNTRPCKHRGLLNDAAMTFITCKENGGISERRVRNYCCEIGHHCQSNKLG